MVFILFYKDKIQYDEPKPLKESIQNTKNIYDHYKGRKFFQKYYREKMRDKEDERKNGFKPFFFKNQQSSYQHSNPIIFMLQSLLAQSQDMFI